MQHLQATKCNMGKMQKVFKAIECKQDICNARERSTTTCNVEKCNRTPHTVTALNAIESNMRPGVTVHNTEAQKQLRPMQDIENNMNMIVGGHMNK